MGRLGYGQFLAVGNDWGSTISLALARRYPQHVLGAHVTQIFESVQNAAARLPDPTPEERASLAGDDWFRAHMSAYQHVQQQPMSLAHALTDSPAGYLGWVSTSTSCSPGLPTARPTPGLPIFERSWQGSVAIAGELARATDDSARADRPDRDGPHAGL
jgi:pimeloyl-ACP methyl ester carboxylesterase